MADSSCGTVCANSAVAHAINPPMNRKIIAFASHLIIYTVVADVAPAIPLPVGKRLIQ
jgi:hypothetical protein